MEKKSMSKKRQSYYLTDESTSSKRRRSVFFMDSYNGNLSKANLRPQFVNKDRKMYYGHSDPSNTQIFIEVSSESHSIRNNDVFDHIDHPNGDYFEEEEPFTTNTLETPAVFHAGSSQQNFSRQDRMIIQ